MRVKYEDLRPELEGYAEVFEANAGVKADEIDYLLDMLKQVVNNKEEMPVKAWTNLIHVLAEGIQDAEQEYSVLDRKADTFVTLAGLIPEVGETDMDLYHLEYIAGGLDDED